MRFTDLDAVLFDFDGVVALSEHLYDDATQQMARELDIEIPPEFCARMRGQSDTLFFDKLMEEFKPDIKREDLYALGRSILSETFVSEVRHTPGYLDFLAEITGRTLRYGLVTSTPRDLLEQIFEKSDLQDAFPQVVTLDDVVHPKPHPEPYMTMCRRLDVDQQRALVIEDSPAGVQAGLAAGCQVAAITTSSTPESLAAAHFIVDSFKDLSELLNR